MRPGKPYPATFRNLSVESRGIEPRLPPCHSGVFPLDHDPVCLYNSAMNQIHPHQLWIGHAGDCGDVNAVTNVGIQVVVQLAAEEPYPNLPRELTFVRIPIHDGPDNEPSSLRLAVDVVARVLASNLPTLVCCSAGASRSPAVAACAIAIAENKPPATCLELVRERHRADVSPALWNDLLSHLP